MKTNKYKVINRKTGVIVAEGKMSDLAKQFEVDKTAIWQAAKRDSNFLRIYKVVQIDEDTVR